MDTTKRRFRPMLLAAGFIFLINGNINVIDILPDFIGWMIIARALGPFSDLEYRLEQARRCAGWLGVASAAKYIVLMSGLVFQNESNILMFSFTFAVIESLLLTYFTLKFFGGMGYLTERGNAAAVMAQSSACETLTVVFFLSKSILGCLPDFTVLFDGSTLSDVYTSLGFFSLIEIKNTVVIVDFALITLLGVAWYTVCHKYFKSMRRDSEFLDTLEERYRLQILGDALLQKRRTLRLGLTPAMIGLALICPLNLGHLGYIPAFVSVGLLCWGSLRHLRRLSVRFGRMLAPALFAMALSGVSFAYDIYHLPVQRGNGSSLYRFLFERDIIAHFSDWSRELFNSWLRGDVISAGLEVLAVTAMGIYVVSFLRNLRGYARESLPPDSIPERFFVSAPIVVSIVCIARILIFAEPFGSGLMHFSLFITAVGGAAYLTSGVQKIHGILKKHNQ